MEDLKELEFFAKLYDQGSISKTAQTLFISQQGLSKSIKGLEHSLNLPLFHRSQSGIQPTAYAEKLYPYVKRLLLDYRAFKNAANELQQQKTGNLNIGFSYGVLNALPIIVHLKEFQANYPSIKINYFDYPDYVCENMLLDEKIDMAFIIGPITDKRIKTTSLFKEQYRLWVHVEHPVAGRSEILLADILDEPIIFVGEQFRGRTHLNALFRKMQSEPNVIFTSSEPITYIYMAYQKAGVAIHPAHWENLIAHIDEVTSIPIVEPEFNWEIFFALKSGKVTSPNEHLFANCILDSLK